MKYVLVYSEKVKTPDVWRLDPDWHNATRIYSNFKSNNKYENADVATNYPGWFNRPGLVFKEVTEEEAFLEIL